ncbi:LBP / BPI / CETP family protein [Oesophagostomum dentatum]|uniref:LBP / BPI / CETP family protein n=1 Tax=Oesophagostomum dentatum TaxID=61180 RepID=A0A0B1T3W8_OESDE|nr:LBP / BPI / CETP family protein [Oesophagostomum dentatum]
MSSQSKQQLQEAICENVYRLTLLHFSSRISKLPPQISVHTLLKTFLATSDKTEADSQTVRFKRASSDDYYDDIEKSEKSATTRAPPAAPVNGSAKTWQEGNRKITFTPQDITHFFNVDRLRHMMIELTLLDASATRDDFTVGMSGQVSSNKISGVSPYKVPFPFRVPQNNQRRMAEIVLSEYSINSLLYFAHRTNSLLFHVDSRSPGVGTLLKTTCSVDEVCLSDQVEEIGNEFPGRSLELIIRSTNAPVMVLRKDSLKLNMEGRCLFFLEGTRQKVGVIPFATEVEVWLQTVGAHLKGRLSITKLNFTNGIEFFRLTADDLEGLRKTTRMALENMANSILDNGIPLSAPSASAPLRLSAIHVSVLPSVVLLQANVDLYSSFYNHSS